MNNRILVTGPTGNAGFEVINILKRMGYTSFYAAVRNTSRASEVLGAETSFRKFDFEDESTFPQAFMDIDSLFLVRPPHISDVDRYILPVLKAAKAEGVRHIVFLSLIGVEKNYFAPHRKIEQLIKDLGFSYTFLRAGFFMQNLSTTHREEIKNEGRIFIPAGNGRTSFIDIRDIAEVAVKALTEGGGHLDRAYDLTGDQALTYYEAAEIMSRVLNRKIIYADPSIPEFFRKHRKEGTKAGFIIVMIVLYSTCRFGLAGRIAPDIERVLGRKPISFEKFVMDFAGCWKE